MVISVKTQHLDSSFNKCLEKKAECFDCMFVSNAWKTVHLKSVTFDLLILEKKVSIFQEYVKKNPQIQVKLLPFS